MDPAPDPLAWELREVKSLEAWGCRFTVFSGRSLEARLPIFAVFIRKGEVPGQCCLNTGYREVHASIGGGRFDLVKHPFLPALSLVGDNACRLRLSQENGVSLRAQRPSVTPSLLHCYEVLHYSLGNPRNTLARAVL